MKRNIKWLVLQSKTGEKLDPKKIKYIAPSLTRSELRAYLMLLRLERTKEKIILEAAIDPKALDQKMLTYLKSKFKEKDLELIKNEDLIGGVRLTIDDNILDLSFRGAFNKLLS